MSLLAALLLSVTSAFSQDTNFWIFLCFGQSNMESGGRMDDQDKTVDKRFQVMADFDSPKRGWKKGHWYDAVPPLAARGSGICMIDYFGRTMVSNLPPNIRIGVIKVSVPGCKIELFEKDTSRTTSRRLQPWMVNCCQGLRRKPLSVSGGHGQAGAEGWRDQGNPAASGRVKLRTTRNGRTK